MKRRHVGIAMVLAAAVGSPALMAAEATLNNAFVTATSLTTGETGDGGCLVSLTVNPRNSLQICTSGWVSFGCKDADGNDVVAGYRMFDQAQLALAGSKRVRMIVSDELRGTHCTVKRIDVLR